MRNILLTFILLIFGCIKDSPIIVNNPSEILNTSQWSVLIYYKDKKLSSVFDGYTFTFSVNTTPNCPDWFHGSCQHGNFGGHYFINDKGQFTIVLPTSFNLNELNGSWEIIIINKNTIYLKRIGQEIKFVR